FHLFFYYLSVYKQTILLPQSYLLLSSKNLLLQKWSLSHHYKLVYPYLSSYYLFSLSKFFVYHPQFLPVLIPFTKLLDISHSPFELPTRSEEHTSELQSRFDLVCRLL